MIGSDILQNLFSSLLLLNSEPNLNVIGLTKPLRIFPTFASVVISAGKHWLIDSIALEAVPERCLFEEP